MTDTSHDNFEVVWSNPFGRRTLLRQAGVGLGMLAAGGSAARHSADHVGRFTALQPATTVAAANGGTLIAALANPVVDLRPDAPWLGSVAVNNFVYESLYRFDPYPPRSDVIPELAADLPEQADPTTYRIGMRQGVVFHDGSQLTAGDVVFSLQRIQDPETESLYARFFNAVADITAVDEGTVEIVLDAPTTLLAQRLVLVRIVSEAAVSASPDALELRPVGTGPYQVTAAVSGEAVTLNRFADYNGDRPFAYDVVEIDVVEDPNARTSGLRSGQYDMIEDVPASSFESLADEDTLRVEAVPSYLATIVFCHAGKPPFDDRRVRQALFYAIDRDTITQTSFFGLAQAAWASPLSPEHPEFVEADTVYMYDPDRARQLLADAGHGDGGIPIDFLIGNLEFLASQGPVIEQNLRDVGFEPNMIPGEVEALYSRVTDGDYNAFLAFTDPSGLGPADAEFLLRWMYYGAVPESFLFWTEDAVDQIAQRLDGAFSTDDEAERATLLGEAQNIIQDGAALLPMHFKQQLTGWSNTLEGFLPLPTTGFNLEGVSSGGE